jgi:hypothetical protein
MEYQGKLSIEGEELDKVILFLPFCSLLFVLAADLLQTLLNKAKDQHLLNLLIPLVCSTDFPII